MMRRPWLWLLAAAAVLSTGCPKPMDVEDGEGEAKDAGAAAKSKETAKTFAIPQEALAEDAEAIKVEGTILIEGYEKGIVQVDVTRDSAGGRNVQPVTIARYKQPGPYTLYLPKGTTEVYLYAFLDVLSDGPTVDDPRGEYEDNPLELDGAARAGVDIVIDLRNVMKPPPGDVSAGATPPPGAEPGTGEADLAAKKAAQAAGSPPLAAGDGGASGSTGPADAGSAPQPAAAVPEGAAPEAAPAGAEGAAPPPTPRPSGGEAPGAVPEMLSEGND